MSTVNNGWNEITEEEKQRIEKCFDVSQIKDLVRHDSGFVITRYFAEHLQDRVRNFELRDDDIWIVTYPKSGTTWTQELVWMLINEVDQEQAQTPQFLRSPFLECAAVNSLEFLTQVGKRPDHAELCRALADPLRFLDTVEGRRVIKTHLPFEFLPPKLLETCKVIYVARNPKDVVVSYYHHNVIIPGHGFVGNFDQFAQFFKEGPILYGNYWQHLLGGWNRRDHNNVMFLWYEDMKTDQENIIDALCKFLDHPLPLKLKHDLLDHVRFDKMKRNPATNPSGALALPAGQDFMRKGQVGDWRNYFDKQMNESWDKWILENITDTGLQTIQHLISTHQ